MKNIRILIIIMLSIFLHFSWLGQEGFANLYYAAGVKSMMMNLHNFFFVSFDPNGFITIDKPPLGFWFQTLSATIFGFKGWSIILPQALGGVVSVYMIYAIVKKYHNEWAGLIAAFVLATTPIFVAASRNNTIDVLLVTTLLLSVLVFFPAAEKLNLKKLLITFFLIGIGFNIKSLEAFMVLPAFYITYFFTCQGQFKKKIIHLFIATMLLIITSFTWFVIVDSISPNARPYVGSSETNSEIQLATGYNGLGHFLGEGGRLAGQVRHPITTPINTAAGNIKKQGGEMGTPGLFRLFNHQMGGQISWLLPFVLSGILVTIYQFCKKDLSEKLKMKVLFWSCWLIPQLIFFSIAEGAHRYYLVMMAPAIAVLMGISYTNFVSWYCNNDAEKRYLLPISIFLTVGAQIYILIGYSEWTFWLVRIISGITILTILSFLWKIKYKVSGQINRIVIIVSAINIMLLPFSWAITPVLYGSGNAAFPFAGPDLNSRSAQSNVQWGMNFTEANYDKLIGFLLSHRLGEAYIVAVPNAHVAAPLILTSGQAVLTYGGFGGAEKILNKDTVEDLVKNQQVRYIIINTGSNQQQSEINEWVSTHGVLVPDNEWKNMDAENLASVGSNSSKRNLSLELYDCKI